MLNGQIDLATRREISGWAADSERPDAPVALLVTANDALIERVLANRYREDLEAAGVADGRRAFQVLLAGRLAALERQVIRVRRESDGADLPGSPVVLEAPGALDAELRAVLTGALDAIESEAELEEAISFLAERTQALLSRRSERRARRTERLAERAFRRRWTEGDARPAPEPQPPRALVIGERAPEPGRAGDRPILSHMRSLQRLGFEVTFAPTDLAEAAERDELERLAIGTCALPWYASVEEALRVEGDTLDLIYLRGIGVASLYLPLVGRHAPRARRVFALGGLRHVRLSRQAEVEKRPELVALARAAHAEELRAALSADAVIVGSSEEAALLLREAPQGRVHVVRWAAAIRPIETPWSGRDGVAFIGDFTDPAELDGARWLIEEVLPMALARAPDLRLLLGGVGMPRDIARLSRPGLTVLAESAEAAGLLGRARVAVAPLTFGSGASAMVVESLAAGIPCVMTPIAAEGLGLPPALAALSAAEPAAFAELICRLHQDEAFNACCSAAGVAYVEDLFSEARLDAEMRPVAGVPAAANAGLDNPAR